MGPGPLVACLVHQFSSADARQPGFLSSTHVRLSASLFLAASSSDEKSRVSVRPMTPCPGPCSRFIYDGPGACCFQIVHGRFDGNVPIPTWPFSSSSLALLPPLLSSSGEHRHHLDWAGAASNQQPIMHWRLGAPGRNLVSWERSVSSGGPVICVVSNITAPPPTATA